MGGLLGGGGGPKGMLSPSQIIGGPATHPPLSSYAYGLRFDAHSYIDTKTVMDREIILIRLVIFPKKKKEINKKDKKCRV